MIAKALLPGDDPGSLTITTLIGIAGAFIGGFFDFSTWLGPNRGRGPFASRPMPAQAVVARLLGRESPRGRQGDGGRHCFALNKLVPRTACPVAEIGLLFGALSLLRVARERLAAEPPEVTAHDSHFATRVSRHPVDPDGWDFFVLENYRANRVEIHQHVRVRFGEIEAAGGSAKGAFDGGVPRKVVLPSSGQRKVVLTATLPAGPHAVTVTSTAGTIGVDGLATR